MPFDPDAYLAKKKAFDPDAYLAKFKTPQEPQGALDKYGKPVANFMRGVGTGAVSGLSLGAFPRPPEQDEIRAAPSDAESIGRKIGTVGGEIANLTGIGALVGRGLQAIPAMARAAPWIAQTARGAITGGVSEGIKGAVSPDDLSAGEIAKRAGIGAATFGALEGPGMALARMFKNYLTRGVPERIATRFSNVAPEEAKRHFREEGETVGKTLLNNKDITKSSPRDVYQETGGLREAAKNNPGKQVLNPNVKDTMADIEGQIQKEITDLDAQTQVPLKRDQLGTAYGETHTRTGTYGESRGLPEKQTPRMVGEYGEPQVGLPQRTPTKKDALGVPVNQATEQPLLQPRTTTGGTRRIEGGSEPSRYAERDVMGVPVEPTGMPDPTGGPWVGEQSRGLAPTRQTVNARYPRGTYVDMEQVIAPAREQINWIAQYDDKVANQMNEALSALMSKHDRYLPMGKTIDFRRDLDAISHMFYEGKVKELMDRAGKKQIDILISNGLRNQIAEKSPKLAALFDRQHFLLRMQRGLEGPVSKGEYGAGGDFWQPESILGVKRNLGAARVLDKAGKAMDSKPGKVVGIGLGRGTETAFSDMIEDRGSRRGKTK